MIFQILDIIFSLIVANTVKQLIPWACRVGQYEELLILMGLLLMKFRKSFQGQI